MERVSLGAAAQPGPRARRVAVEALVDELAGFVARRCPGAWLAAHGLDASGTLEEEAAAVRADVRWRLARAMAGETGAGR